MREEFASLQFNTPTSTFHIRLMLYVLVLLILCFWFVIDPLLYFVALVNKITP